jgi:hypothetical protein
MKEKIVFIIPLYGKIPEYINLFLKSASFNSEINFLLFTDLNIADYKYSNIKHCNLSLDEFKKLIHKKTAIEPKLTNLYKIVDFKSAYGLIFQDYIRNYEFWGVLDVDLILGEISEFITPDLLEKYDVISARKFWLSGSFALFRNTEKINLLFKKSKDWQKVFASEKLFRFTECGTKKNSVLTPLNDLRNGKSINEIELEIESFTNILVNESNLSYINVYFNDMVKEVINKNTIIGFENGKVFIYNVGKSSNKLNQSFLHYHFVSEKSKFTFSYPHWQKTPNEFYITEFGFFKKEQLKYLSFRKYFRILKSYFILVFVFIPQKVIK